MTFVNTIITNDIRLMMMIIQTNLSAGRWDGRKLFWYCSERNQAKWGRKRDAISGHNQMVTTKSVTAVIHLNSHHYYYKPFRSIDYRMPASHQARRKLLMEYLKTTNCWFRVLTSASRGIKEQMIHLFRPRGLSTCRHIQAIEMNILILDMDGIISKRSFRWL